ncbi:hypothetical protein ZIOFF_072032 [Zingiber officinale]|uniref:Transposase n=1 Tax=Zingiber officinale TaxID=94328 RepID=A0A8J5CCC2_ZINOF|nr:hypothetical protein ZIOFF_072032 [Zingiber officinale]
MAIAFYNRIGRSGVACSAGLKALALPYSNTCRADVTSFVLVVYLSYRDVIDRSHFDGPPSGTGWGRSGQDDSSYFQRTVPFSCRCCCGFGAESIYASKYKADSIFTIRKCNLRHTCGENNLCSRGHPKADATWIANVVKDKLRGELSYRPCRIQKDLQRDYRVELDYHKLWKGKKLAIHDIHGTEKGCYDRLRWYGRVIRETNPASVTECEIDPVTSKFKRLFIYFHACAVSFLTGCMPLIFLDETHIKNKYKSCILVIVSKDANDDLFTIGYSVVDAENDANWE